MSVTPKQITYVLGLEADFDLDIAALARSCSERVEESKELLEVAWELIASGEGIDGGSTTNVAHVAQILFDTSSPELLFTAHLMLSEQNVFFKQRVIKGSFVYEARTAELVEAARHQQQVIAEREQSEEQRKRGIVDAVEAGDLSAFNAAVGETANSVIQCLQDIASELDSGSNSEFRAYQLLSKEEQTMVRDVLGILQKPILPISAFEILVQLGIFSLHENLALRKANLLGRRVFSDAIMYEVETLISGVEDVDRDNRVDYSMLQSFAIDSADTTEIDDAVAWDPDTGRVLVHIADPTRYFPDGQGSLVLDEAMRRSTTAYLPVEKLTMFPERLAVELFSLNGEHTDGSALTFSFSMKEDGSVDEDNIRLQPSIIAPPIRLTYEQADEIITKSTTNYATVLQKLSEVAERSRAWREMEGGAIFVKSTFSRVDVDNVEAIEPTISLGTILSDGPAWTLVSEFMVTACTIGATIGKNANIHLPYRCQEPFEYPPDEVIEAVPDGPARAALIFKEAPGTQIRTEPDEHASLGVDAYAQVTSPIRRSADLVAHFQLKAFLRGGKLPYSVEDVNREIARVVDISKTIRGVENRTKRYWQLEYMRQRGPDAVYRGTFVKTLKESGRKGIVNLDDFSMQIICPVTSGMPLGQQVLVKVLEAEPRTNILRTECSSSVSKAQAAEIEATLDDLFSDISSDSDGSQ